MITQRNVDVGDLTEPGPQGQPLFVVARNDLVRIIVSVPEMYATEVEAGDRVLVRLQALSGRDFEEGSRELPGRSTPRTGRCTPRSTSPTPKERSVLACTRTLPSSSRNMQTLCPFPHPPWSARNPKPIVLP